MNKMFFRLNFLLAFHVNFVKGIMEESKTMQLLDFAFDGDFGSAKGLCKEAKTEIGLLESRFGKHLTDSQKKTIENVRKIIDNLNRNQTTSAKVSAFSTSPMFTQHILPSFYEGGKMKLPEGIERTSQSGGVQKQAFNSQEHRFREKSTRHNEQAMYDRKDENRYYTSDQSEGIRRTRANNNQSKTPKINSHEEYERNEASKRASHALRFNNPDIADLSDINRPTKLAEKFSELYDNEWTEAFESLSKTTGGREKDVIKTLLELIEDAYKFCQKEADSQIKSLQSKIIGNMKGEQVSSEQRYTGAPHNEGRDDLIKYRKVNAKNALPNLLEKFKRESMNRKYSDERMRAYVDKAVELTWWMAVQDPPVYMCPSTTRNFDSNLYKPYTRSGSIPDYFVWPALKLYKDGGLLMKGVVQYKQ